MLKKLVSEEVALANGVPSTRKMFHARLEAEQRFGISSALTYEDGLQRPKFVITQPFRSSDDKGLEKGLFWLPHSPVNGL